MNTTLLTAGALCMIVAVSILAKHTHEKQLIGSKAPQFTLYDENKKQRSLSDFLGKKVVLYFYPKDDTPGCTKEACSFRDAAKEYAQHDIVVLGINYDSPETHKKFKEKYHLPFILLSDKDGAIARAYGAYKHFWHYFAPKRITFLIDENGIIIKVLKNIDVSTHAQDVFKKFSAK